MVLKEVINSDTGEVLELAVEITPEIDLSVKKHLWAWIRAAL